ncbi:winged helix-turn-helix transcriptional regulator [Niabella hibiscisoli]|uniref:winged helix-turn-helix transcriptional regulator n=1 Tax=Niabella hibiscisoli TaxID=1825928 RepID=UPI001F111F34|nr:helix-turn-helix domain-containing protein [Niabella hibiscisoli]MCH5717925.1 helix-turn-helix transcriptional regulator [Niabella hibiscisoli]
MKSLVMRSRCPISCTLDLLGDKWSLLILRDLLFFEKNSFGAFLLSREKIARNILSDRLEHLLQRGFMVKEMAPENKSKFLYYPTEKAVDLVPLLLELAVWSEKHEPFSKSKPEVTAFKNSKGKALRDLKARMRTLGN